MTNPSNHYTQNAAPALAYNDLQGFIWGEGGPPLPPCKGSIITHIKPRNRLT